MSDAPPDTPPDWKLRLRQGQLQTPFCHFTLIAPGRSAEGDPEIDMPAGQAFIAVKCWAEDHDMAFDLVAYVAEQVGFQLEGQVELYETEPDAPPRDQPYGYDIAFTPFTDDR